MIILSISPSPKLYIEMLLLVDNSDGVAGALLLSNVCFHILITFNDHLTKLCAKGQPFLICVQTDQELNTHSKNNFFTFFDVNF